MEYTVDYMIAFEFCQYKTFVHEIAVVRNFLQVDHKKSGCCEKQ
jgi:hypothetical protein